MSSFSETNSFDVDGVNSLDDFSKFLEKAAESLEFEYFAYGQKSALPLSNPKCTIISNYPIMWRERYSEAQYVKTDPSISASRRSIRPLVWSDAVFADATELWGEAREFGLNFGCAQSIIDSYGNQGMLTFAREHESITLQELQDKSARIKWLAAITHERHSLLFETSFHPREIPYLSKREVDILRWSADGKTAVEISIILKITSNTVNFHLKNIIRKLNSSNKVAAVMKAATMGLL